jgi:antitoxin component of MazEF toxin-antitoxin module
MNATLKITKIGNSAGVVLPKDVLARLRVGPEFGITGIKNYEITVTVY